MYLEAEGCCSHRGLEGKHEVSLTFLHERATN